MAWKSEIVKYGVWGCGGWEFDLENWLWLFKLLYFLNSVHDVVAAVAKAHVYLKCKILGVLGQRCYVCGFESCRGNKKNIFFVIIFFLNFFSFFFHLHWASYTLGGVHKICGPNRRRGSTCFLAYVGHSSLCNALSFQNGLFSAF